MMEPFKHSVRAYTPLFYFLVELHLEKVNELNGAVTYPYLFQVVSDQAWI